MAHKDFDAYRFISSSSANLNKIIGLDYKLSTTFVNIAQDRKFRDQAKHDIMDNIRIAFVLFSSDKSMSKLGVGKISSKLK